MNVDTWLTHVGLHPEENSGIVNPPVYHASTVLYDSLDAFEGKHSVKVSYGRNGTPTTFALEEAFTQLEGGAGTVLVPSGLAAITTALLAFARAGSHMLFSDSVYGPTRRVATRFLTRLGVETEFYDPRIGARIAERIRENTALVFVESPGSLTFEVQDLPAISAAARKRGATVVADNTWGAGLLYKPLALGADVVVHAGTKYVSGHADVMAGAVISSHETLPAVRRAWQDLGQTLGPDDAYLALRGLRTLGVRLPRHQENGLALARWLNDRPEVTRVMHPALPDDPGHELWQRDFAGACGLFGFLMDCPNREALAAFLDALTLFGLGDSWGGYESLLVPTWPERIRSATPWESERQSVRVHAGLEDPKDLIVDLEEGFRRMHAAS